MWTRTQWMAWAPTHCSCHGILCQKATTARQGRRQIARLSKTSPRRQMTRITPPKGSVAVNHCSFPVCSPSIAQSSGPPVHCTAAPLRDSNDDDDEGRSSYQSAAASVGLVLGRAERSCEPRSEHEGITLQSAGITR